MSFNPDNLKAACILIASAGLIALAVETQRRYPIAKPRPEPKVGQ